MKKTTVTKTNYRLEYWKKVERLCQEKYGAKIDKNSSNKSLLKLIAGLRAFEVFTTNWDAGSIDPQSWCLTPWIHVEYPEKPSLHAHVGQEKIFRRYAKKLNIDYLAFAKNAEGSIELWKKAVREAEGKLHTPEYKTWLNKQLAQKKLLKKLLTEFYIKSMGMSVKEYEKRDARAFYYQMSDDTIRLEFGGTRYNCDVCGPNDKKTIPKNELARVHKLLVREAGLFADFLKAKFLNT